MPHDDWQIHHINPLFSGGTNGFSNLIPLRDKGFHHAEGIFGTLHFFPDGWNPRDIIPMMMHHGIY